MSKPQLSATITSPEAQSSKIGTLAGEHGLAMLVGSPDLPKHPDPDAALRMMGSLRAFSAQLPGDEDEAALTRGAIVYLSTPAPGKWIAGRVLALLSHYFAPQQDAGVTEAVAEDWCAILEEMPAWAISNACRWWLSRENPDHRKKPIPGDIQQRAYAEMTRVRAAQITVARGVAPAPSPERVIPAETLEERRAKAAEIMAGFATPKAQEVRA